MPSLTDGPGEDPRAAARRRSAVEAAAALRDAFRSGRRDDALAASGDALRAAMATADARGPAPAPQDEVENFWATPAEAPCPPPPALIAPALRSDHAPEPEPRSPPEPIWPVAPAKACAAAPPAADGVIDRLEAVLRRAPAASTVAPALARREPAPAAPAAPAPFSAPPPPSTPPPIAARRAEPSIAPAPKPPTAPHAAEARRALPSRALPQRGVPAPRPPRRAFGAAFGAGLFGLGVRLSRGGGTGRRSDPSPPLWRYRLDRLRRRASVQFALRRLSAPLLLVAVGAWLWNQQAVWVWGDRQIAELRQTIAARPEFAVTGLAISGGGPRLRTLAHEEISLKGPVSSLELDLDALRKRIEALPGIASARLTIGPDGILRAALTERIPVALWRWEGQLHLVDREGVVIGPIAARADRPALPLIIGAGADRAVPEALALQARAAPLHHRLRALVRVGERRWTLALDRDQVIMLPAKDAEPALARVLALDAAEDLLAREVMVIDMRLPQRPTLRMTDRAVAELLRLRAIVAGEDA
jgi:cell division protein FtsQ